MSDLSKEHTLTMFDAVSLKFLKRKVHIAVMSSKILNEQTQCMKEDDYLNHSKHLLVSSQQLLVLFRCRRLWRLSLGAACRASANIL